jgi:hypothetical protein
MESRKIRRLEFVSDKIDGGDCKREVICIRFGHPSKKNEFVWGLHGRWPWPKLELHGRQPWGAHRRGERRGRRRGGRGRGLGAAWGAARGGGTKEVAGCSFMCCCAARGLCCSWEEEEKRKEKGEVKEKEGKEKEKKEKYGKFSKIENFWKIKDNLWSWSKFILVQKKLYV